MFPRFRKRPAPQAQPLFALGSLQLSEKVYWLASKSLIDPLPYVQRHLAGDWGDAGEAEQQANAVGFRSGCAHTFSLPDHATPVSACNHQR